VFCRHCGHQNPEQNRFCGSCGNVLAPERGAEPEYVGEKVPITMEQAAPQAAHDVARAAEPGDTRREPEITVSGPSFLGLSSSDSGEGGGYSYLFEEEQQSHIASWVLMVLLLVLGGLLYAKWQPIRDYLLTTSITHSRPQQQQPTIITENKTAQPEEGLPQADKPSPTAGRPDDSVKSSSPGASSERAAGAAWKQPAAKSQAANDEASANPADDKSANPAAEEKPRKTPAPQDAAGGDLVSSGEKYLYGRGVARNCDLAVSYFNAAAAKQDPKAFSHLGALYATGECVPLDRAMAYAWFRRAYAKEPGNRYFEQNLTMLWRAMTPRERQRATGKQ
jgi:hypothetical protein